MTKKCWQLVVLVIVSILATGLFPAGAVGSSDSPGNAAVSGVNDYALVVLQDPPVASYSGGLPGYPATKPIRGRLDPNSPEALRYRARLAAAHANYRSWLARSAPRAEVVREYFYVLNGFAIKLNGTALSSLGKGPGAARVGRSWLYRPTMDVSPGLIGAPSLWSELGGSSEAGKGIRVAIIDTGIDITNPFFSDADYEPITQTDGCSPLAKPGGQNTNNKVIVCRWYASGVANIWSGQLLAFDHGTHVAGTVAGNFGTSGLVTGTSVTISGMSGVAPKALLGDYNVFPGFGAGYVAFGGSAFSHDIAAALEDAVLDSMDVVNMSLGGAVQGPHDFLAEAVNATVDAGLVVAVAAGNSGPAPGTVESPGTAAKAITVGASTNPHYIGVPVTLTVSVTSPMTFQFEASIGEFDPFSTPAADAEYAVASPSNGCTAISGVFGKIAIIDRGVCSFTTKVRNAQNAGAIGVIVVNNVAGDPIAMAQDGTTPVPTIPAVMVSKSDGSVIKGAASEGSRISVDGRFPAEVVTPNADILAGFSSRGPTPFTYLIKPDVTAPGVNVVSSIFDGKFAFFQGTSMATPHVAGAAALLRQLHPGWTPADVKSALVTTAKRPVWDHLTATHDTGVMDRGGGRIDLSSAGSVPLTFDPASVSFGLWTGNRAANADVAVRVKNVTSSELSCSVSVIGPNIVGAAQSTLTVPGGGEGTLVLQLRAGRSTPTGQYSGDVQVECASTTLTLPWWVGIDRRGKT